MTTSEAKDASNPPHIPNRRLRYSSRELRRVAENNALNIEDLLDDFVDTLEREYLSKSEHRVQRNLTVYSGLAGIILTFHDLYELTGSKTYLYRAAQLAMTCVERDKFGPHRPSFLQGHVGMVAITIVVLSKSGDMDDALLRYLTYLVHEESKEVLLSPVDTASSAEIMYGRAGYLWTLLWLKQHQQKDSPQWVPDDLVRTVAASILNDGRKEASRIQKSRGVGSKLHYRWHNRSYIGAAHGMIGILYVLLKAQSYLPRGKTDVTEYIIPTIKYIVDGQFRSGNFGTTYRSKLDRFVQWCHGAPGFVIPLLEAYGISGMEYFRESAVACGEVIWKRGLLRKGNSLCHGIAGNGYAFLSLYNVTRDNRWYYRADIFAHHMITRKKKSIVQTPDRPFSLFEGLTGVIHFLAALSDPAKANFPGFQLGVIPDPVEPIKLPSTLSEYQRSNPDPPKQEAPPEPSHHEGNLEQGEVHQQSTPVAAARVTLAADPVQTPPLVASEVAHELEHFTDDKGHLPEVRRVQISNEELSDILHPGFCFGLCKRRRRTTGLERITSDMEVKVMACPNVQDTPTSSSATCPPADEVLELDVEDEETKKKKKKKGKNLFRRLFRMFKGAPPPTPEGEEEGEEQEVAQIFTPPQDSVELEDLFPEPELEPDLQSSTDGSSEEQLRSMDDQDSPSCSQEDSQSYWPADQVQPNWPQDELMYGIPGQTQDPSLNPPDYQPTGVVPLNVSLWTPREPEEIQQNAYSQVLQSFDSVSPEPFLDDIPEYTIPRDEESKVMALFVPIKKRRKRQKKK